MRQLHVKQWIASSLPVIPMEPSCTPLTGDVGCVCGFWVLGGGGVGVICVIHIGVNFVLFNPLMSVMHRK